MLPLLLAAGIAAGACGGTAPTAGPPAAGLLLLGLADGSPRGQQALGEDPVSIELAADGTVAYVSDNRPGRVRAVALPSLRVLWTADVGGRPGPLLATLDAVYVSLFDAGQVAELAVADGAVIARHAVGKGPGQLALDAGAVLVHCADGEVWDLAGGHRPGGGPGFALGGGWSAAYGSGDLLRLADGASLASPPHLHPFWLAPGAGSTAYAAAEGDDEDRDPGAVLVVEDGRVDILAPARDPDQVAYLAGRVFTAAHADRQVLVLDAAGQAPARHWAAGSSPVALATDPRLGLLIVVVNATE